MADEPPIDPVALMRAFFPAWAKGATDTAAPADAETPTARMMAQALAAANMPSRDEVAELAVRLDRITETLARIERRMDATDAEKAARHGKRKGR